MAELQGFKPELISPAEQTAEQAEHAAEQAAAVAASQQEPQPRTAQRTAPRAVAARPIALDPIQKEVEFVLSENIAEIFKTLSAAQKAHFKKTGEDIAMRITAMIKSGIIQVKKILQLIREWLTIIPGVNNFFLEQEAKIKTDKIQEIYAREHARAL